MIRDLELEKTCIFDTERHLDMKTQPETGYEKYQASIFTCATGRKNR